MDKLTGMPIGTNIRRMNVLIADDHPIFRTSLRQVLTDIDADVAVVEAADFDEAIDVAAKRNDLDLILVDLMMPGKDPIEGLQAVVRAVPEVPVLENDDAHLVVDEAEGLEGHELGDRIILAIAVAAKELARCRPVVAHAVVPPIEPPDAARVLTPRILLLPLLAVDSRGNRLGYGAGFYDRTLTFLRQLVPVVAVGIGFEVQRVADVPYDGRDAALDWVVTETSVYRCAG